MQRPRSLAFTLLLCSGSALFAQDAAEIIHVIESPQVPNRQGLDPFTLAQLMDRFHVPAVSVAVIRDFKIQWAKAWGVADVQSGAPADTETMFQAASISKPVAAMASLKAIQNGKFRLNQDVNTILKTWKIPKNDFTKDYPVTPRALMTTPPEPTMASSFQGNAPTAPLPSIPQFWMESRRPFSARFDGRVRPSPATNIPAARF